MTVLQRQLRVSEDDFDPHLNLLADMRSHFSDSTILTNVRIVDALRQWYPGHSVTQTSEATGLLDFARAGKAQAILDGVDGSYSSRKFVDEPDEVKEIGLLKDEVDFGRYKYRWEEQDFLVYAARYYERGYNYVDNHYVLYPREDADMESGRSKIVDELIIAAAEHRSKTDDQIWLYDKGHWSKSHKLWESVQGCKWEDVILNQDMKAALMSDIEGFLTNRPSTIRSLFLGK